MLRAFIIIRNYNKYNNQLLAFPFLFFFLLFFFERGGGGGQGGGRVVCFVFSASVAYRPMTPLLSLPFFFSTA